MTDSQNILERVYERHGTFFVRDHLNKPDTYSYIRTYLNHIYSDTWQNLVIFDVEWVLIDGEKWSAVALIYDDKSNDD